MTGSIIGPILQAKSIFKHMKANFISQMYTGNSILENSHCSIQHWHGAVKYITPQCPPSSKHSRENLLTQIDNLYVNPVSCVKKEELQHQLLNDPQQLFSLNGLREETLILQIIYLLQIHVRYGTEVEIKLNLDELLILKRIIMQP